MSAQPGRVLVLELNEITWDLMDPLMDRGLLPNFRRLLEEGVRGEPHALEVAPDLDPWVTWTTLYTGVPQETHGLKMLEQDKDGIGARWIWDYLKDAGLRLGIYGSANTWPPLEVNGFWVPGPFSRDYQTYPRELEPIQAMNIGLVRGHATLDAPKPNLKKLLPKLMQMGLQVSTLFYAARTMLEIKRTPRMSWKKVALHPVVNLDLFAALYRKHRPHFATFHSNHVAYYMHRFWRAYDPSRFEVRPTQEERETYQDAIPHGYIVADRLLGQMRELAGPGVTLVVLSSCGQQPATGERYNAEQRNNYVGIQIYMKKLLDVLGIADRVEYSNLMAPQWKIDFPDAELMEQTIGWLKASRNVTREIPVFRFHPSGRALCLGTPRDQSMDDTLEIATARGPQRFKACDLLGKHAEVAKAGIHHPKGVLLMHGPAVRRNALTNACDNLDLAPTLLTLLGQPVPSVMKGRVLTEALKDGSKKGELVHAT